MSQAALQTKSIPASFRDPAGSLFRYGGRLLRVVNSFGAPDLDALLAAPSAKKLMASGRVVPTRKLEDDELGALADPAARALYDSCGGRMILEHERIDFPSFPYEWNPLADIIDLAAELTTNLLVIECMAPDDTMFQRLTHRREELHKHLNPGYSRRRSRGTLNWSGCNT